MRGWTWAGPCRSGSGFNYRDNIWEHLDAQMALTAADLQCSAQGHAIVAVCVYVCVFLWCVHAVKRGHCGPLQKSEPLPVAFSASVILGLFLLHFSLRVTAKYCAIQQSWSCF